jgi:hypothetical protein
MFCSVDKGIYLGNSKHSSLKMDSLTIYYKFYSFIKISNKLFFNIYLAKNLQYNKINVAPCVTKLLNDIFIFS